MTKCLLLDIDGFVGLKMVTSRKQAEADANEYFKYKQVLIMITSDYFSYDMLIGGKSDSRMKTNTSPRKFGNLSALCIHTLTSSVEQNLSLYKQQIFNIRNRNETVPKIAYPIYFSWYQQFFS